MLARTDQVEILPLDLVHHVFHLGKAHDPVDHVAADHEGGHVVGEAPVDHEVARIGEDRRVQPRDIAAEVIEPVSACAAGAVEVDAAQLFHDLHMVGDLEVGHRRLAELFHFDVFAVVLPDRHRRVDDVRDDHHPLFDLPFEHRLLPLEVRQLPGH